MATFVRCLLSLTRELWQLQPLTPPALRSGVLGGYIRLMDTLSRVSAYLACAMFVAGVVICQMVFIRYVLGMSTSWQTEFTIFFR